MVSAIRPVAHELRLLDLPQIADLFGVCTKTIRAWIDTEGFPKPKRIGKRLYWKLPDVNAYLDRIGEGATNAAV